jgi:hypothetical protein
MEAVRELTRANELAFKDPMSLVSSGRFLFNSLTRKVGKNMGEKEGG